MSDTLEQEETEEERRIYVRNTRLKSLMIEGRKPLIKNWDHKSAFNKSYG